MEEAVSKGREALAAAHRSDEDRQVLIFAFRHASSVIAKAKVCQATCLSLSLKSMYSLLRSVAGFSSSSSSSPSKSALIFANYLRCHFLFPS